MTGLGRPLPNFMRLSRLLSTYAASGSLSLVRDFIHDSLYNPSYGYFSNTSVPVGTLQQPNDFASLHCHKDYLRRVQQLYRELQVSWLTPVEIFQPHYGSAIAHYIMQHHTQHAQQQPQQHLRLYEIGGGTGTLARNILDWLRRHQPDLYGSCRYTCIEISPSLAQAQHQKVAVEGGHAACFDVVQHDGAGAAAWGGPDNESCYVIMMEVLDNLPHDRVWREHTEAPWQQTLVASQAQESMGGMHGDWTSEPFMHPPHQHLPQQHLPPPPPPPQQQQQHPPHQHLPQQGPGQPGLQQHVQQPSEHGQQPPEQQHQAQSLGELHQQQQQQQQAPFVGHQLGAGRRERFREVLQPVADPLILRCLECFEREEQQRSLGRRGWGAATLRDWIASLVQGAPEGEAVFLPTACLGLLDTLHRQRPRHHLIAADFDELPEVVIVARNAPLVATTAGGHTIDHATYLVPRGAADIFFPTDFSLLRRLYTDAAQRAQQGPSAGGGHAGAQRVQHMKTADFMRRFAADEAGQARTRSGYNPLLEDYTNTSFFLASF